MSQADDDLLDQVKSWFKRAAQHSHKWRLDSREAYDFVAGVQWSEEDAAFLRLQQRPNITFNRTGSVIDSVSGLEVSNRQEVRFIPRQLGNSGVNELLTAAGKWVRDECNAEDEESDSFMDLIICGIGCTETRLDYDVDPEGKCVITRTDPMEMFIDASSRQRNFSDAKHILRVKEVTLQDAEDMFPDEDIDSLSASWATDISAEAKQPHDAMAAPFYRNDQSPNIDKTAKKIRLVEVQWWEHTSAHRVVDPVTKKVHILSKPDFKTVSERADILRAQGLQIPPLTSAEIKTRKYYRAIVGNKILKRWDGPESGGFTYKFMTGKRDRNRSTWYGLVKAMIDPQRWANKWLSQVLHIINVNAKGGLMAEKDAFENPQQAEETWADPAAITILSPGALEKKKLMPKPVSQYPQGIEHLMQFAISSIRDVAGVNLELLGMAQRDQPGILENQRKQAGMTILANFFDSLRHYRKDQGKLLLWYITNFLADGRLIRIGGQENAQYVPLVHKPGLVEYDVIVDDAPSSPNQKEQTWAFLVQIMPFLAKMAIPPQVMLSMLKMSPLPSAIVAEIQQAAQQAQQTQQQQPNPEVMRAQTEQQVAGVKSQAEQMRAKADVTSTMIQAQASAQASQAAAAASQAQAHKTMAEAGGAHQDTQNSTIMMLLEAMVQAQQAQHDQALDRNQQAFSQSQDAQDQSFQQDLAQQQAESQAAQQGVE